MRPVTRVLTTSIFALATSTAFAATPAEPANVSKVIHAVEQYHNDGTYHKQMTAVTNKAAAYLQKRVDENRHSAKPKRLAVVFDIDETLLSNYAMLQYYWRQFEPVYVALHSGHDITLHFRKSMRPTALPSVQHLYNLAKQDKVVIFLITGTREDDRRLMTHYLRQAGYSGWVHLYMKPMSYHLASAIPYKSALRKKITAEGYDIVFSIGDQFSDLKGGYADHDYKLPDPYYYIP